MLTTVLLSALAATIAVVIVRQTILVSETSAQDVNSIVVRGAATDIRKDFDRELAGDSQFYLDRTFAWERPRQCLSPSAGTLQGKYLIPLRDANGKPVSQPWPAVCGNAWAYPGVSQIGVGQGFTTGTGILADGTWDAVDWLTRAEVSLPGPSKAALTLDVLAAGGSQEAGLRATYLNDSVSKWSLYSWEGVNLTDVTGDAGLGAGGSAYSEGAITIESSAEELPAGLLASETTVGAAPAAGSRVAIADPTSGQLTDGYENIRDIAPSPLDIAGVRQSYLGAVRAGCTSALPYNLTEGSKYRVSHVCLKSGSEIVNTNGDAVSVPEGVDSWLAVFRDGEPYGGSGVVDLYYTTQDLGFLKDCEVNCDLTSTNYGTGLNGVDPSVSPGSFGSPWRVLGSTWMPRTGVLFSERDVFVSTKELGSQVDGSITVAAGTGFAPANIYLSGDVQASAESIVGVIASGAVYIPYFAAEPGGSVVLELSATGLGYGLDPAVNSVDSLPSKSSSTVGRGTSALLQGSVAGMRVGGMNALSDFSLQLDERVTGQSSPMYASFSDRWLPSVTKVVSSKDLCPAWLSSNAGPTCLGGW